MTPDQPNMPSGRLDVKAAAQAFPTVAENGLDPDSIYLTNPTGSVYIKIPRDMFEELSAGEGVIVTLGMVRIAVKTPEPPSILMPDKRLIQPN